MTSRHTTRHNRRGAMTLIVLLALAVVVLVSAALVRAVAIDRSAAREAARRSQAEWLAYSGCQRAIALLARDPAYSGETWDIGADDLRQADGARVEIVVEPIAEQPMARRVRARAIYPADADRSAVRQQALIYQIPDSEEASQ